MDLTKFDHHDPGFAEDPFGVYSEMRQKCPVLHSEAHGGYASVTKYDDIVTVAKDDYTYLSGQGVSLPRITMRSVLPMEADPPEFFKYRRLLNPLLSPAAVAKWEEPARQLARQLLEAALPSGHIDFVSDFARQLPAIITLRMLGLPESQASDYLEWINWLVHYSSGPKGDRDLAAEVGQKVYGAVAEQMELRRGTDGGSDDGILSYLMNARVDDEPLTDDQILDMIVLLIFGGLDTTAAAIANSLAYLDEHHEERDRLISTPSLLPLAVEEFLRFEAPVQGNARTIAMECNLGGRDFKPGEKLMIFWASGNRDEDVFDRPNEIILDRQPNRHLAFGVGNHRCLGAHLARIEFRVALEEVLRLVPRFSIDRAKARRWEDLGVVYGYTSLPAVLTAP